MILLFKNSTNLYSECLGCQYWQDETRDICHIWSVNLAVSYSIIGTVQHENMSPICLTQTLHIETHYLLSTPLCTCSVVSPSQRLKTNIVSFGKHFLVKKEKPLLASIILSKLSLHSYIYQSKKQVSRYVLQLLSIHKQSHLIACDWC